MDILRRELDEIYARQMLSAQQLDQRFVVEAIDRVKEAARCTGLCCVVSDLAADCSYFIPGYVSGMLGLNEQELAMEKIDSSDEDFLYSRILPMDLAELRMLEYEFFKIVDAVDSSSKLHFKAFANISMHGASGIIRVNKTTQVLSLSPLGKIWLVLCCYDFAPYSENKVGIHPIVADLTSGHHTVFLDFANRRADILTPREKQVLRLIAEGKLSKEIASALRISVNTVNRHRQNILEKLTVDNSMEAVRAASAMGLMP